jgi:DNA segregation ATPase FtsK/SpoIIIE, S-DNA-T family
MASFQARHREPMVNPETQAVLERKGKELLGVLLVIFALCFTLALASYSPDDPGWMVVSDTPAQNWLGWFGAGLASTLMIILGKGAWTLPLIALAWGVRFITHRGEERAVGRLVFAVFAIALASVFASTHAPGAEWSHSFGLGGLFGDTILGAVVGFLPFGMDFSIKFLSLVSGLAMLALLAFVCGFIRVEMQAITRFLLVGTIMSYAQIMALAGKGAEGAARAAQGVQARRAERRATQPEVEAYEPRREPMVTPDQMEPAPLSIRRAPMLQGEARMPAMEAPREKLGLLARVQNLTRRAPEPELIEPELPPQADMAWMPSEDRIKARISDAIRAKTGRMPPEEMQSLTPLQAALARREPSMTRRGPAVLIASKTPAMAALPPEPPVTAMQRMEPVWQEPEALEYEAVEYPENTLQADHFDAGEVDWEELVEEQDDDIVWDDARELVQELAPAPIRPTVHDRKNVVLQTMPRPAVLSRKAIAESQPRLRFDEASSEYELPPLSLLSNPSMVQRHTLSNDALEENARMLENVLDDYGVKGEIVSVRPGPVVTMYELEPAPGLKASRVIGLADDIARSMSALSARVSTVPGRTVIGIELPNAVREKVVLREILSARDFGDSAMRLPLALGKDIGGEPIIANLAKMPHLLIAGTTGSGKSVAINTMILSLLYKLTPEECRLIMIDPKMLELSVYDGIPHLLSPVVTDPKKAVVALKWVVGEMEERYRKMSKMGVRNIEGYNGRVREALDKGEMFKRTIQTGFDEDTGEPVFETEEFAPVSIPYIVVVVDEMADLMMVAGKEIEACIQRLAQMARASGIHLIMATQRPSVDVITGTIKANFPTRISFQVTSKIDSRTILGEQGAEQLLGMGDMLYMAGGGRVSRIHGPFVSDEEVEEVVNHLKSFGPPSYMSGVVEGPDDEKADDIDLVLGLGSGESGDDQLYDQAVAIVAKDRKCSTSYIQRKLGIGYNKAARLVEQMEEQGVVTPANHVGKREILVAER